MLLAFVSDVIHYEIMIQPFNVSHPGSFALLILGDCPMSSHLQLVTNVVSYGYLNTSFIDSQLIHTQLILTYKSLQNLSLQDDDNKYCRQMKCKNTWKNKDKENCNVLYTYNVLVMNA